ncbi:MAG: autotransporter-associated beta strand repeat-containing protein, partial [Thermoguttaceae bacterium]
LSLNGHNASINGLGGSGTIDNSVAGSYILTVGNNNATSTFSGAIKNTAGTVSLAKAGTGTLTLSGTNSYSGGTTVSDGLLVINRSAALPSGSILTIGASGSVELGDSTLNGSAIPLGGSPSAGTLAPQGVAADGIHAVPEPGTLALLAAAAACGMALRRKKGI